jgi:UDP-N-acetylglucosamine 1-carboxyvinyltransferase
MLVHLVDGTYELFRHFYAMPPEKNADGLEVAAIQGVLGSMLYLLGESATHLAVATDHVIESFRNDLWAGYKDGSGVEQDLRRQFPVVEDALRAFGAVVEKSYEGFRLTAPNGLKGAQIELPYPSVGATEQVLLTAVRAEGVTELKNAAIEPEIMDLIAVLQKMGAIISVDTDRVIRIEGVDRLGGFTHRAMPDRIEAASWACAALATKGDITVLGARQQEMMTFLNVFRKVGGELDIRDEGIRFSHPGGSLNSLVLETDVHPGFMTDWQQPLVVALTQASGLSIVHETVYENRFGFTQALRDMGAQVQVYRECLGGRPCRFGQRNFQHSAVISGPAKLHGADITVPDLRGGFSHLIAALAAEGTSRVRGIGVIDRGYEAFEEKLGSLGANYERG